MLIITPLPGSQNLAVTFYLFATKACYSVGKGSLFVGKGSLFVGKGSTVFVGKGSPMFAGGVLFLGN